MIARGLRRARLAVVLLALCLGASACDFDVYSLPLPGGPDVGSDPIVITAQFGDVLDLVPKSTVKVDDVSVGRVTDIELDGYTAVVTMELNNDVDLPDNAVAQLRQTSLLGEKFVDLSAPRSGASDNKLETGDVIGLDRTGRNPEVEEVLGALSLILNGGGVAQLKTIAAELNKALEGREDSTRSVLQQMDTFASTLDDNKADIVNAIEKLNRLAVSVRRQQGTINNALDELPSALRSINRQRSDLVTMLQALDRLGGVGVRVIKKTKANTITTLKQLRPILTELANAGSAFVNSFNVFLTYPFVDEVVGRDPQVARNLQMGDYTNLSIELDLDLSLGITGLPTSLPTLLPTELDPTAVLGAVTKCLQSGNINSKACQKVLNDAQLLLQLREECQKPKNKDVAVCTALNLLPGLPQLPGSNSGSGGSGGGLGGVLPTLPGLGRAGALPMDTGPRGPTYGQLQDMFDPGLVSMLVPGMVTQ
ncbi:MCE family protein [Nocardioides acrostichi]|uniref:MCE family protein n=1 Tax=Nocardioides acrostichi TaxID=2784339 RepID=A0A930Y7X6_9ACTN|nr:MCE family protein [Nocardioides acrostichi]MBF4162456.1 MCE family protein [Nocardioides acrostichi]